MLTDFQNYVTDRFMSKYVTKSSLTIPPHLTCVPELYLVKHPYRKIAKIWCMHRYQQQITRYCSYMFEVWWAIQ